ncbi:metal ABC transporter substrate-binding protein [uncultured Pseudoteredinibacter sp.]|uniref:metal ABC transporter substrate-binding protein n=1 Tax=uncultured Pseudoteredinibacter sp. TaxID=1641701 RepID=UPI002603A0AA|nr:metal ABC transporter substrate-binding protein [uncultured Pseudoteredinibacter sp.]
MWSSLQRLLLLFCLSLPASWAASEKPVVLASIEPLAKIARELLGDRADVEVLLPAGANPHQYALKISDLGRIKSASLLIWNGPALEPYLQRAIVKTGVLDVHFEDPQLVHTDLHQDPHYWLSPLQAMQMAEGIVEHLSLPASLLQAYQAEQLALLARWREPLAARSVAVYHDGYSHLAEAFDIHIVAAASAGEGKGISLAKRLELRSKLQAAPCLLAEPYSEANRAKRLAEQEDLPLVWLDPLANSSSERLYHPWMEAMLTQISGCFKP